MIFMAALLAFLCQFFFPQKRLALSDAAGWALSKVESMFGHGPSLVWVRLLLVVLPVWIVLLVVIAIIGLLTGPIVRFLITLFLAWALMDFVSGQESGGGEQVWVSKLSTLFTPLFWFAILGMPMLLLVSILRLFAKVAEQDSPIRAPCEQVLAILAWIPSRLMILAFALISDFAATLRHSASYWMLGFKESLQQFPNCWAQILAESMRASDVAVAGTQNQTGLAQYLRVLVVWFVVMAVFTVGYWVS